MFYILCHALSICNKILGIQGCVANEDSLIGMEG